MAERCSTCRYWWQLGDSNIGQCRRYPPRQDDAASVRAFPRPTSADWCGEWKALPDGEREVE